MLISSVMSSFFYAYCASLLNTMLWLLKAECKDEIQHILISKMSIGQWHLDLLYVILKDFSCKITCETAKAELMFVISLLLVKKSTFLMIALFWYIINITHSYPYQYLYSSYIHRYYTLTNKHAFIHLHSYYELK